MAIEDRFKQYANWRKNPFTGADMSEDATEDNLYIPSGSPFLLQLNEVPRKDDPSTVSIWNYDDGAYMTEVQTSPVQGEFRVDYPSPDGEGTGLVEFNQNDAGKKIKVEYKATGSPNVKEILDIKLSKPDGDPGKNQVIFFPTEKWDEPAYANNPIRYFHEGEVIYHASGEDESCVLFRFKKSANESKVFLELKGAKLWQGFYTEVASHYHGAGTLQTIGSGGHYHTIDSHSHGLGTLTGSQPTHRHGGVLSGTEFSGYAGNDTVTISGSIAGSGQLQTNPVTNHTHGMTGSTAETGTTPKTYPDQLKVYVDDVNKTANILSKSGLDKLGDGTGTHAFVTAGTGEMDITDLISGDGFHEIAITEPISNKGGRVLLHCELY